MKNIIKILLLKVLLISATGIYAQCDTIADVCSENFTTEYISDGQLYRAMLTSDEVAEFDVTFFGNTTYRIAACSGFSEGYLIFSIYDPDNNLLFTNKDYGNAPYWDFDVKYTVDCKIEATLDNKKVGSGCAVLLIGYKQ